MKQQVARLSPHQNGKVFAVLMAASALVILLPLMLIAYGFAPNSASAPPLYALILLPLFYLVVGYITVAIGCLLYNWLYPFIGGIEFEARAPDARP